MITPTIGRVIWIYGRHQSHSQPEPALIAFVHDDGKINVGGFDKMGMPFALHHLKIAQDGEELPSIYAAWMPYQLAQASAAVLK